MPNITVSHAGGRSKTITGAIVVILGAVLSTAGIAIPEDELGEAVNLTISAIGILSALIGACTSLFARYGRGDVTITGRKVADSTTQVIRTPPVQK